jgi:hypothetical protein
MLMGTLRGFFLLQSLPACRLGEQLWVEVFASFFNKKAFVLF